MTTTQQAQQEREDSILAVCEEHRIDEDAFLAWCDNFHITSDYESQVDDFTDAYAGCYDSFQDYEKFARDLQYDYWTHEDATNHVVYIFRNH